MKSWMTSLAGVGAILTSAGAVMSGLSKGQFDPTAMSTMIAGLGLMFAKDWNVTGGSK